LQRSCLSGLSSFSYIYYNILYFLVLSIVPMAASVDGHLPSLDGWSRVCLPL